MTIDWQAFSGIFGWTSPSLFGFVIRPPVLGDLAKKGANRRAEDRAVLSGHQTPFLLQGSTALGPGARRSSIGGLVEGSGHRFGQLRKLLR